MKRIIIPLLLCICCAAPVGANPQSAATQTRKPNIVFVLMDDMTTRQIEDLPLNGRNYLDLAKLLPGVQESAEDTGKLNTNGTRSDATGYIQDGISNRIDRGAGQAVVTSPDTIQEFRVETSTYSSQYGRTAGAQIQVISKTGTNKFSGSLFEFARNDAFDAKDPFLLPTDSKKLNRHQFGWTIGGPLPLPRFGEGAPAFRAGKNRSFFFFSFDGFRERRSVNASTQAPHADWLRGDFRLNVQERLLLVFPPEMPEDRVARWQTFQFHCEGALPGSMLDLRAESVLMVQFRHQQPPLVLGCSLENYKAYETALTLATQSH